MKKWVLYTGAVAVILGIAAAVYVWFFVYNKPHRDIESATPDFTLTAEELIAEFDKNDTATNGKYNEKVIQFSGKFKKIESADTTISIVFDYGTQNIISAEMLPKYKSDMQTLNPGAEVVIKGLYKGYIGGDDLFGIPGNIALNQCSPIK